MLMMRPKWFDWLRPQRNERLAAADVASRTIYQNGSNVVVTITTQYDDTDAPVRFHWWVDGQYVGFSNDPTRSFYVDPGDQLEISCLPCLYADFDPSLIPPRFWTGRRTVEWIGSTSSDIAYYLLQWTTVVSPGESDWTTFGKVPHDGRWSYRGVSPRFTEDAEVQIRVLPYDFYENKGTALAFAADRIVTYPAIVNFTVSYSSGTQRVTYAAA